MATIQEKLADSLLILKQLQNKDGLAVIKSSEISRIHLERLMNHGFLQEVMKGWYISSRPGSAPGDSTNWYTSYWYFISEYANARFGRQWCLSADQSLSLYSGNRIVPGQIIIRSQQGSNNIVRLMHNTSLFDLKAAIPTSVYKEPQWGLNLYSLPEALIECSRNHTIADRTTIAYTRIRSPYVMRLKLMWNKMREVVIDHFPKVEQRHTDVEACLEGIEAQYKRDAYHSLSIEGYKVTDELIEKVKRGNWKPDEDASDAEQR
ncbi:MAG: cell filamentation protein Fic, partial [Tannerellaceae bacterium]|nr:cell filamentation protein Fic [Tannerellaceae bacterium]